MRAAFPPLVTLLLAGVMPAALSGQERSDTVHLTPVVVTATRLPVPRDAVAASVTVIPGAELRAQGIRTVLEALRRVAGATVVQTGSFGGQTSLFLRGGESDYVKVLVDGVPLNQPGGAYDFAHLTTDNVDRIEIVRGPVSVLYGSDAVAGVVQVFTRNGTGAGRGSAGFQIGTYGTEVLEAQLAGGSKGGALGYAFTLSRLTTDGLYPFNNAYRNSVLSGRVRLAPDGRSEATLTLRYADHVFHFPTGGAGTVGALDTNQYQSAQGPTLALELGHFLRSHLEVRALFGFQETAAGFIDDLDSPTDLSGSSLSRDTVRRVSAGLRANWHVDPVTVLTAGAEFERQSQRGRSEARFPFGDFLDSVDVRRRNWAYFAQALMGLGRPFSLNAGVRLEDNEGFGAHTTYRAGVAYRVSAATRLRASYGEGFKEPTFLENYGGFGTVGDPNLQPERSSSWEAGIEQSLAGARVSVSATYFNQDFRDLIEFDFGRTPNYFNVARATADGVEFGARADVGRGVAVALDYTYLRTRATRPGPDTSASAAFSPGRRLLRRPTHAGSVRLGVPLVGRGTLSAQVLYVGRRDDLDFSTFPAPRARLPAHTRVDLSGEYELFHGRGLLAGLALSGRVENLLDRRYEEAKNFPARGRTILFGGEARLGS